jgi:chaperonin GroES
MDEKTEKQTIGPIGDRVLVQRIEQEAVSKGGLILPDAAKKKNETARVVAVGTGITIPVKVGDQVITDRFSGQEVTLGDDVLVVLSSEAILAVLTDCGG